MTILRTAKRILKHLFPRLIERRRCKDCFYFHDVRDCDERMFQGWPGRCSGKVEAFFVKRKPDDSICERFKPDIFDKSLWK